MKKVEVYFPKSMFSGLVYGDDHKIKLLGQSKPIYVEPKLNYYSKVWVMPYSEENLNSDILIKVWDFMNTDVWIREQISDRIKRNELDVSHSTLSVGDIINIDDTFYIVDNYSYKELDSNDLL